MSSLAPLSTEERARHLVDRREALLAQLPARFAGAWALGSDTRELIIDEAIEYASLGHTGPITSAEQLTALFWGTCANRVKRAHEGRYDTVRGGYRRDGETALETLLAAGADEPLAAAMAHEERQLLAEVLNSLSAREREVIAVKYMGPSNQALGYKKIARHLALPLGEVRAAERSIREKFDRFATAARARESALERKLGQLLPVPPAVETHRGRLSGWRDVTADWIGRPFASDGTTTAAQMAASGAGRGAGSALAIKLATLCIGTGGLGAACVATGVLPTAPAPKADATPAPRQIPTPTPTTTSTGRRAELQRARATATPSPTRRAKRSASQGGTGSKDHETKPASPAPSNAATDGASEFDPTFQPDTPAQPAPPPAAPGSGEFF